MKPLFSRDRRFLVALLMPFIATFVQWFLWNSVEPFTWLFYYPAAFAAALIGGLRGGVAATLLSALFGYFIFIEPQFTFHFHKVSALTATTMFVIMGIVFSFFPERVRTLYQKAARRESDERLAAFLGALPAHAWMKDEKGCYAWRSVLHDEDRRHAEELIVNGRLDRALYEAGRLGRSLPFEELRRTGYITQIAETAPEERFGDYLGSEIERRRYGR